MGILRKTLLLPAVALSVLAITACGGGASSDAAAEPAAVSEEQKLKNTADCGILGKLIGGEIQPSVDNIAELEGIVTELSQDSAEPVKNMAAAILPMFDGGEVSAETELEEFKTFCMDYASDS